MCGGAASPPERMKSPGMHAWRRVSRKDCRNICDGPRNGKRGRRDTRGAERSEPIFKEDDWSLSVVWTRCDLGDSNELVRSCTEGFQWGIWVKVQVLWVQEDPEGESVNTQCSWPFFFFFFNHRSQLAQYV